MNFLSVWNAKNSNAGHANEARWAPHFEITRQNFYAVYEMYAMMSKQRKIAMK